MADVREQVTGAGRSVPNYLRVMTFRRHDHPRLFIWPLHAGGDGMHAPRARTPVRQTFRNFGNPQMPRLVIRGTRQNVTPPGRSLGCLVRPIALSFVAISANARRPGQEGATVGPGPGGVAMTHGTRSANAIERAIQVSFASGRRCS